MSFELAHDRCDGFSRYGEAEPYRSSAGGEDGGSHADDRPTHRHERPSGIAPIDGRIGLQEVDVGVVLQHSPPCGDDAGAHGLPQAVGIVPIAITASPTATDWEDPAEARANRPAWIFEQGDIRDRVGPDDAAGTSPSVR